MNSLHSFVGMLNGLSSPFRENGLENPFNFMTKPTIAYVTQFFPILTETFVYREVCALRAKGYDVRTFSNRTPDRKQLSDESLHLMADTEYVFPIDWKPFLSAHLSYLTRHPLKYVRTLWQVMGQRGESWGNRKRTLGHFGGGVYLAKKAKEQGVQHVHAHFGVNAATIALVIAQLNDITFSFTAHQIIFTDQLILREKLKHAHFIAAISEYSRDYLIDFYGENGAIADKFHIVHCGISPEQFRPKSTTLSLNGHKPLIFSLARLDEKKGMPYLIEACRILHERGIDFECIIGGDGEQMPLLQQMVADYSLGEIVTLTGRLFQEDLEPYFNRANLFALGCVTTEDGDIDGIPVVLMEAMAMGVPTISTSVSGIPELIEHEKSGLLVPEKDPVALADAMERLLANPAYAQKLAQAGCQKVRCEFNIHHTSDQLAALFEQFVGKQVTIQATSN